MRDTSEHCARADLTICWETLANRICQKYSDDRHLVSAAEELRKAINDYFETLGWTPNELAQLQCDDLDEINYHNRTKPD